MLTGNYLYISKVKPNSMSQQNVASSPINYNNFNMVIRKRDLNAISAVSATSQHNFFLRYVLFELFYFCFISS